MSPQVTFHPKGRSIDVPAGTGILEAAILAGVEVNSACAGKGICGRCRVVVEGDIDSQATPRITEEDWASGYRLACLSKVKGDCVVFVPEESQLKPMQIVGGKVSTDLKQISPLVRAIYAKLRPPTLQDNDADLDPLGIRPGR